MAITTFIPTVWSARLEQALQKAHVAANLVNREYEGTISNVGDKVKINRLGSIAIKTYTKNTNMASPDDLTTTETDLTINQAKYFNFQVDDIDAVQAAGNLVDEAMTNASYGLADASDKYLLGVMSAGADPGNITAEKALTASNIYQEIVALRLLLDKQNVPTMGRFIVVPPEAYALLLQDSRFVAGGGTQAEDAVRTGFIGKVAGFDVYESNNVPEVDKSTYKQSLIIASVPQATTYAEQVVKTEAYRMESRFADAVKGLHVYGAVVTKPEAVAVLTAKF